MFNFFKKPTSETPQVFRGPAGDYLITDDFYPTKNESAKHLAKIARKAVQDKDYEKALLGYRQAAIADSSWWFPYSQIGVLLDARGDIDGAIGAFKRTLELCPQWSAAYFNLGKYAKKRQDFESAIGYFMMSLALSPSDPEVLLLVALCHERLGHTQEENKFYRAAISQDNDYSLAHLNYAINLIASGDKTLAKEHLRRVLEIEEPTSVLRASASREIQRC